MDEDDRPLTVDDIITGRVAENLGPGVIPVRCLLIVETLSVDDASGETLPGMRYLMSQGTRPWQVLGLIRSTVLKLEADDLGCWQDDEEDDR